MAISVGDIVVLSSIAADQRNGTNKRKLQLVSVEVTTDATTNTLDLSTYCKCSGILSHSAENFGSANGLIQTQAASSWSGTTITFAGHTGSGTYKGFWLVYA